MDFGSSPPPVASTSAAHLSPMLRANQSTSPSETSPIASTSSAATATKGKFGAKRAKTQMSCQECRRLKLKCDRIFPCSNCRRRGREQLCPHSVSKAPGRAIRVNAELNALLRRVEDLENALTEVGAEDRIPPPIPIEFAGKKVKPSKSNGDTAELEDDEAMDEQLHRHSSLSSPPLDAMNESTNVEAVLQGVGSLSIREEDGRVRYLGTSAAPTYYFQDEDDADDDLFSESEDPPSPSSGIVRYPFIQLAGYYSRSSELERLRTFLPHPTETSRLVRNYYDYLSFQFEPVEKEVFNDDYLPAAQTIGNSAGTKLAFVFIVLSLGALIDPEAPSPSPLAHHYFQLSQATLAASRFLSNNTLAAVQTIQLTASFLLNTHDLQEGGETLFPLLGMALRMLVAMGMHRDGSQWGIEGPELDRRRMTFYELITIERYQAFISGRPYMLNPIHFDTKFPPSAEPYHLEKWQTGVFIAKVIDECFSVTAPVYSTVLSLDQDLRKMFENSPAELRSGALPNNAFTVRPDQPPELPEPSSAPTASLKFRMRQHTLDMVYSQILFYLHLPALRQALKLFPGEPLSSPWAESVAVVALETGVYMLAIAKSWINLHPVASRWWHPTFHAFAAACAQSSIVIQSPNSALARHSWSQLMIAIAVFEKAAAGGAPVALFVPRLHALRDAAFKSLREANSVPNQLSRTEVTEYLVANRKDTDADLSILGTTTRLDRKPRRKIDGLGSNLATMHSALRQDTRIPFAVEPDQVNQELYTPFDSPVLIPAQRPGFSDLTAFERQYDMATPIPSFPANPFMQDPGAFNPPNAFDFAAQQIRRASAPASQTNYNEQNSFDPQSLPIPTGDEAFGALGFTNFATGAFSSNMPWNSTSTPGAPPPHPSANGMMQHQFRIPNGDSDLRASNFYKTDDGGQRN